MFLFISLNQRPGHEFVMNSVRPRMPPFGVAYVAASLAEIGIRSVLHDDNLREFTDEQMRGLFRRHKGELRAVGLTSVSTTLRQLERVARLAKDELPDVPVLVGGPHARLLPEEIISIPGVDVVFTTEAELTIREYARGTPLDAIGGVWFRKDSKIVRTPPGPTLDDLDQVPFPAYDLFNIAEYHATKGIAKRRPASYVITSRGCPYDCGFCSSKALNPTRGKRVRFRSPENVLDEVEWVMKAHGVRELFFSDDMFTGNTQHFVGICEGIIKRRLDLLWTCMTHVRHVNPQKLRLMKAAGCHQLCFGVESGDPDIQKAINKNLDLNLVRKAARMAQEAGLDVRCSFMFGNQGETRQTMQNTIDFATSLDVEFAAFNIAAPYPGTRLRQWAIEQGYLANPSYEALDSTAYALVTKDLPSGTVEAYCNQAFRAFYYNPRYVLRRIRKIRDLDELGRVARSAVYAAKSAPAVVKGLLSGQRDHRA
jgi:anaerobic magnesium-protoporphyrin IX monomethyl ester cyclase